MYNPPVIAACVIPAGGSGSRFGGELPKQFLPLGGISILRRSTLAAAASPEIGAIVIAAPADAVARARSEVAGIEKVIAVVAGGATRVESVGNALAALGVEPEVILVHDAARPLARAALFSEAIASARAAGGAIVAVRVDDTVKRVSADGVVRETVPREALWRIQTPQAFRTELLRRAHAEARKQGWDATDDAALVERVGGEVRVVEGDAMNFKITTREDLALAERLLAGASAPRTGFGRDKHPLVAGRPFVMGGVQIEADAGPLGHSDGDALCHAIADAMLGAAVLGDIGKMFPDDADATRGISGPAILGGVAKMVREAGLSLSHLDATVWTRKPRLAPHVVEMRETIARALGVPPACVSVKAKSGNGIDSTGRGESVEAEAVVTLVRS